MKITVYSVLEDEIDAFKLMEQKYNIKLIKTTISSSKNSKF